MTRETISTALGLVAMALRDRKAELRECTDLARRKRLVARIEQLRAAHAELDTAAMDARAERLGLDADLARAGCADDAAEAALLRAGWVRLPGTGDVWRDPLTGETAARWRALEMLGRAAARGETT